MQRLQGAAPSDLVGVMSDEQLTEYQPHVRFDVRKAVVEGVIEGSVVFVVVIGVGLLEGLGKRRRNEQERCQTSGCLEIGHNSYTLAQLGH